MLFEFADLEQRGSWKGSRWEGDSWCATWMYHSNEIGIAMCFPASVYLYNVCDTDPVY
jgi:hypothetical protein